MKRDTVNASGRDDRYLLYDVLVSYEHYDKAKLKR